MYCDGSSSDARRQSDGPPAEPSGGAPGATGASGGGEAAAAGAASSAHESLFQVIAAAGLQVRDGAAHSCKQVGFLPSQSLVRISARNGEWARLLHPRFGGHHSVWICEAEGGEPTTRLLDLRKAGR